MITITREQKLLLDLVSGEITGKKVCLNEDILNNCSWDILLEEAQAQAVQLMLAEPLSSYKDKINNWEQWQYIISCSVTANVRTAYYEQQLYKLLDGYPFFILKGMAAASYYPTPHERMLGDIDFLIDPSQKGEIETLLENDGYEKYLENHICHVVLKKNDAHLEMHWEIAGIPYGKPGEIIRKFMSDAVLHRKNAEFDGWSFPAPDDLYHGLIILLHMQHHMLGEGIGIRHLCDWACYVQKTKGENFWNDLILLFKRTGLLIYAKVMTKTCSMYLGIECPDWACDADNALCRDVIEDILTGGNFGRKDTTRAKSGMMISEHGKNGTKRGKAANLFYTLHHSTASKYPIVRKMPLLYPFFDLWRVLIYSIRVISGKRIPVTKMLPLAKQRRSVYTRLHIFEIDEKEL